MCEECRAAITPEMKSHATAIDCRRAELVEMLAEMSLEAHGEGVKNGIHPDDVQTALAISYGPYVVGHMIAAFVNSPQELRDVVDHFVGGIEDARTLMCADGNLWK